MLVTVSFLLPVPVPAPIIGQGLHPCQPVRMEPHSRSGFFGRTFSLPACRPPWRVLAVELQRSRLRGLACGERSGVGQLPVGRLAAPGPGALAHRPVRGDQELAVELAADDAVRGVGDQPAVLGLPLRRPVPAGIVERDVGPLSPLVAGVDPGEDVGDRGVERGAHRLRRPALRLVHHRAPAFGYTVRSETSPATETSSAVVPSSKASWWTYCSAPRMALPSVASRTVCSHW